MATPSRAALPVKTPMFQKVVVAGEEQQPQGGADAADVVTSGPELWCQAQGFAPLVCALAGGMHVAPRLAAVCRALSQAMDEAWVEFQRRFPRRIYVIGGLNSSYDEVDTAWRLDPAGGGAWEALPPIGCRTAGPAAVLADSKLFVLGGERAGQALRDVRCCDPARRGGWAKLPRMLTARVRPGAACCGDRYLYVVGGLGGGKPLTSAERLDLRRCTWEALPDMHRPRYASALAELPGGRLVVFGGELTHEGAATSIEVYEPESRTWTLHEGVRPPGCGAAVAVTASGRHAFCFGGLGLSGQALKSADVLTLGEALAAPAFEPPAWAAAAPMPTARQLAAVAGFGAGAVAIGGKGPTFDPVADAELLRGDTMTWERLPPLPEARLRAGVACGRV